MSIELEWKSFIQNDNCTTNNGQPTNAKFFSKSTKFLKKNLGKPCPAKGEIDVGQAQAADSNKEERVKAEPDDDDNLNLKVVKSIKGNEEESKDDRKWTRDVIFEAEQIIIKSELDNMEVNRPFQTKQSMDDERLQRCKSSSSPSLLNSSNEETEEVDSTDVLVSNKSSILTVAKKISRSTSRSLKAFNKLGRRSARINNDKNVPMSVRQQQREEGACALLRAARNDSVIQIQTLVSHGISTEIVDQRGWTPLTIALENENMKCAEVLGQMNANVNFVHANGMTILHHITSIGIYKGLKFLLRHGANVNAEDSDGWPPVHYAIKQHHLKCTALLLAAGCDSQAYTHKRVKEYEQVVRTATVGKWKFHWQEKLDIDMSNEIHL